MHFHAAAAPGRKEVRIVYNFLVNLTEDILGMSSCFWSLHGYAIATASEPSGKQARRENAAKLGRRSSETRHTERDGRRQLWSPYYKYVLRKCIVEQESLAW